MGLEEPPYFLAQRASGDVDDWHFHVASLHVVAEVGHRCEADRCNVEFALGIFLRHFWGRDWLRNEDDSLAPIEKDGLPHFHDNCKRIHELLGVVILYEFADDDSFQGFVSYFDHWRFNFTLVGRECPYLLVKRIWDS